MLKGKTKVSLKNIIDNQKTCVFFFLFLLFSPRVYTISRLFGPQNPSLLDCSVCGQQTRIKTDRPLMFAMLEKSKFVDFVSCFPPFFFFQFFFLSFPFPFARQITPKIHTSRSKKIIFLNFQWKFRSLNTSSDHQRKMAKTKDPPATANPVS